MDEPDDLAEIRTPWWKRLSFLHWLAIGIAVFVLVIYVLSSTQSGIRELFPSATEGQLSEYSEDPEP